MVHQCFILGVLWCHVLYLIKSLSHFQFVFVYGVWEYSHFIDFHVAVQLFQHHLLKRLSFLCSIYLPPLSKLDILKYYNILIITTPDCFFLLQFWVFYNVPTFIVSKIKVHIHLPLSISSESFYFVNSQLNPSIHSWYFRAKYFI